MTNKVIIVGASTRAAAWSALRAGLQPFCVDLFADRDLCRVATARAISAADYPERLERILAEVPPAPWLFTGALENHPRLIERLSRRLPLWGSAAEVLRRVRSPFLTAASLQRAGLPCPAVRHSPPSEEGRWLLKPRCGAGGRGITFWDRSSIHYERRTSRYFQEWIDGPSCSALFLGMNEGRSRFLGATRQFIGLTWLNAGPFQYCGSAGPLPLSDSLVESLQRLGSTLARDFDLRGLFGVDCVVRDDVAWPVEINPRYTASTEIVEWATGQPLLARHAEVFGFVPASVAAAPGDGGMLAKAILYASRACEFPSAGPWCETLARPWQPWAMPEFADIPQAGQRFLPGEPILTLFARGENLAECTEILQRKVRDMAAV